MFRCWSVDPEERPPFSELVGMMSNTLESMAGYMHVQTLVGVLQTHDDSFVELTGKGMKQKFDTSASDKCLSLLLIGEGSVLMEF